MNLNELLLILHNNFFANLGLSMLAEATLSGGIKKIYKTLNHKDVHWQMLHCMEEAYIKTCENLGWEYDSDVISNVLSEILKSNNLLNENTIIHFFSKTVGSSFDSEVLRIWFNSFRILLLEDNYEQLREYIKLNFLFVPEQIPSIQKKYIDRFKQPIFSKKEYCLSLEDLYFPNNYYLNSINEVRNDLLNLICFFVENEQKELKAIIGNQFDCKYNALFIFGHQCCGKSTLISKILYDNYCSLAQNHRLILISFSDRSFRDNELTPLSICNYCNIKVESLKKSTLIIDGLDESEWPITVALQKIELLINDLKEYECQLIVTCRPSYLHTLNLENTLSIYLRPFSIEQTKQWLGALKADIPNVDINKILNQIDNLPIDIKEIVLIPYVLFTCVNYNINISQVTGIAQLYDMLFGNTHSTFYTTPYNTKHRIVRSELNSYKAAITEIALRCLSSNDNSITREDIEGIILQEGIPNTFISEFLLCEKEYEKYGFLHTSIPHFFIGQYLYDYYKTPIQNKLRSFCEIMLEVSKSELIIDNSVFEFVNYFATNKCNDSFDQAVELLYDFLSGELNKYLLFNGSLEDIEKKYYAFFINLTRFVFSFIPSQSKNEITFFDKVSNSQKKAFIKYTNLGNTPLNCLAKCSLKHVMLNGINFNGINLSWKHIEHASFQNASFVSSNIEGAYILYSDFSLTDFSGSNCRNVDFSDSCLFGCNFQNTKLNGTNFINTDLCKADFRGSQINKCKFDGAKLIGAKFDIGQLRFFYDCDLNYIKSSSIEIYNGLKRISNRELENEFKRVRPVSYAFYTFGKQFGN